MQSGLLLIFRKNNSKQRIHLIPNSANTTCRYSVVVLDSCKGMIFQFVPGLNCFQHRKSLFGNFVLFTSQTAQLYGFTANLGFAITHFQNMTKVNIISFKPLRQTVTIFSTFTISFCQIHCRLTNATWLFIIMSQATGSEA